MTRWNSHRCSVKFLCCVRTLDLRVQDLRREAACACVRLNYTIYKIVNIICILYTRRVFPSVKGKSLGWKQGGIEQSMNLLAGGFDEHYCPYTQKWSSHVQHLSDLWAPWNWGGLVCVYMYVCLSLFHGKHERREMCMYAHQVLNSVSNETWGMVMYLCFYVCACLYVWVFLLVCTLHPWAMMAPFLIWAIVVGLSPGSTSGPLTLVKICQVNFLRISCDDWILSTSRQQALKFLKEIYWIFKKKLTLW